MKKTIKFFCVIYLVLLIGFLLTTCDTGTPNGSSGGIPANLVGTWYNDSELTQPNFRVAADGRFWDQGAFNLFNPSPSYSKTSEAAGRIYNLFGTLIEYNNLTTTTLVVVSSDGSIAAWGATAGKTLYRKP
ncbi:MAG: hypothetical protein FWE72_09015 [Spirochaetaceae bacterium]|nr:hypothetical protein [Spirochaetaceae bacterium]